jgi:hypothetical protein
MVISVKNKLVPKRKVSDLVGNGSGTGFQFIRTTVGETRAHPASFKPLTMAETSIRGAQQTFSVRLPVII